MSSNPETESQYSQMKNNVIEQVSRISEIVYHAGKFVKFYSDAINIIESLNTMIESYVVNSKKAILFDLYDQVIKETDFKELQKQLKVDINEKCKPINFQYVDVDCNYYDIDSLNIDEVVNMYNYANEATVKEFKKYQKIINSDLENLLSSFDKFEQDLCEFRINKFEGVKRYVDTLYRIHVKYVQGLKHNKKVPDHVMLAEVEIEMDKSQSKFIKNGLKRLLNIE